MKCLKCGAGYANLQFEEEMTIRGKVAHFKCTCCGWRSGFVKDDRREMVADFQFKVGDIVIEFKEENADVMAEFIAECGPENAADTLVALIEYWNDNAA